MKQTKITEGGRGGEKVKNYCVRVISDVENLPAQLMPQSSIMQKTKKIRDKNSKTGGEAQTIWYKMILEVTANFEN